MAILKNKVDDNSNSNILMPAHNFFHKHVFADGQDISLEEIKGTNSVKQEQPISKRMVKRFYKILICFHPTTYIYFESKYMYTYLATKLITYNILPQHINSFLIRKVENKCPYPPPHSGPI